MSLEQMNSLIIQGVDRKGYNFLRREQEVVTASVMNEFRLLGARKEVYEVRTSLFYSGGNVQVRVVSGDAEVEVGDNGQVTIEQRAVALVFYEKLRKLFEASKNQR